MNCVMVTRTVLRLLILFLLPNLCLPELAMCQTVTEEALARLNRQCLAVRRFRQRLDAIHRRLRIQEEQSDTRSQKESRLLLHEFEATLGTINGESRLGDDVIRLCRAELQARAGDRQAAIQTLLRLVNEPTVAAEALSDIIELDTQASKNDELSVKRRLQYWHVYAKVLPLSNQGRDEDNTVSHRAYVLRDRPIIPRLNYRRTTNNLVEIADLLFEMKLYEEAEATALEAIYYTYPPFPMLRTLQESWLSPRTAGLWLQISECAWHRGEDSRTIADYLAKALVFGSEETKDKAGDFLRRWQQYSQGPNQADQTSKAHPDAAKLLRIAAIYADMNMHPRAIALLKQYGHLTGPKGGALQEQYQESWLRLLSDHCENATCQIFGQDVSRPESRLNVTLPPPLRKESLQEAARLTQSLFSQ